MPKVVDHNERRREVVRAVWRIVGRDGLDALTTRAVAREAGWSTGVLAHYFTDRTDLLVAAFRLVAEEAEARMRGRLAQHRDPVKALKAALGETVPLDEMRRTEARVWFAFLGLAAADASLRPEAERHYETWLGVMTEAVSAVLAEDQLAEHELRRIASRLVAHADGLTVQALFEPDRLSVADLKRQLEKCVADTLAAARIVGV